MAFQFTDDHELTETEKQIQVRYETCEKMLTPMVRNGPKPSTFCSVSTPPWNQCAPGRSMTAIWPARAG